MFLLVRLEPSSGWRWLQTDEPKHVAERYYGKHILIIVCILYLYIYINIFPCSFEDFTAKFEDSCLLNCNAVSVGEWFTMFWKDRSLNDAAPYLRTLDSSVFSLSLSRARCWHSLIKNQTLQFMKTVQHVSCYLWYQCIIWSYAHVVYLNTYINLCI